MSRKTVSTRADGKIPVNAFDVSSLCSRRPTVPVMQAAEASTRNHRCAFRRSTLNRASIRSVFLQGIVNPVPVVVDHVLANQPPQVRFVQRDDVVEKLAPTASDPTLGRSVLPGCLNTGPLRREASRLQECDHILVELRIVVEDHVRILTTLGKRFPQLLYDPIGTRLAGDIEMQDSAPGVFDHKKTIQE